MYVLHHGLRLIGKATRVASNDGRKAVTRMKWHYAHLANPDPSYVQRDRSPTPNTFKIAEQREAKKCLGGKEGNAGPRRKLAAVLAEIPLVQRSTFDDRIKVIKQSGGRDASEYIQETAILILEHIERSGDCSGVLRLIEALPVNDRRKVKLRNWFERFSPVRIKRPWSKVRLLEKDKRSASPVDLMGARAKRFWEMPEVNEWSRSTRARGD